MIYATIRGRIKAAARKNLCAAAVPCIGTAQRYSGRMTTDQAYRLCQALYPHVNYLLRLKKRCDEALPSSDQLRVAADRAYQAAWELSREAHRQSVRTARDKRG